MKHSTAETGWCPLPRSPPAIRTEARRVAFLILVVAGFSSWLTRYTGPPQFFRGHRSRLGNLTKARGTDEEKAVLVARSASMSVAEKIYASLQREALGIGDRDRGGR